MQFLTGGRGPLSEWRSQSCCVVTTTLIGAERERASQYPSLVCLQIESDGVGARAAVLSLPRVWREMTPFFAKTGLFEVEQLEACGLERLPVIR